MVLECSTGELLARDAFMHRDDQGDDALMHCVVLKGLKDSAALITFYHDLSIAASPLPHDCFIL